MKELYAALMKAQNKLGNIPKKGRGQYGEAVAVDDAVKYCRNALLSEGLMLVCLRSNVTECASRVDTGTGSVSPVIVLEKRWELHHPDSGQKLDLEQAWPLPEGRSALDEASKSDSRSLTYFLRGLLMFERGGEDLTDGTFGDSAGRDDDARLYDDEPDPEPKREMTGVYYSGPGFPKRIDESGHQLDPLLTKVLLEWSDNPGKVQYPEDVRDADRLRYLGWRFDDPSADELCSIRPEYPAPPELLRALYKRVVQLVGDLAAKALFAECGIEFKKGARANAYQARFVAFLAIARRED